MTTETRYEEERLARLLQTLRPAPLDWVTRAQQIPVGPPLTEIDVKALSRKLENDADFRQRFDADPLAAAESAGMHGLATQLVRELRELVTLAERITNDDAYRAALEDDPQAAVVAAGIPGETAEPLLRAFATVARVDSDTSSVNRNRRAIVPESTPCSSAMTWAKRRAQR